MTNPYPTTSTELRPPASTTGRHRRDRTDDPSPRPDQHAADLAAAEDMSDELVDMVATLDRIAGVEVHGELTDAIRPILYDLLNHVVDAVDQCASMFGVMSEVDQLIDSFEGR